MTITVEYFAQLRTAAGLPSESHELPEHATIADLIASIRERHVNLGEIIGRDGALPGWITVVVNGVATSDPASCLPRDATVRLLAPISGG